MMAEKALVIFSGGQDSSTCLFWAKKNFGTVEAIAFDYNQRHRSELVAAAQIASWANVALQTMALPLLNDLTENSLTRKNIPVSTSNHSSVPNTLVEGRNLLFLTYAAIYARQKRINHLVTGVSQTDYSGYPDCRESFIRSACETLSLAMDYAFEIHTPLMHLTKCATWKLADDLGVFELIRDKTVTCYEGIASSGCGDCPACRLRQKGLREYCLIKESYD